ncbi:helix-hairpin-helix domain-containing protein [Kineococcus sp. LSe6-4]|uniref:Helix-hairpin-helix domain-containing protein n=1 Tax=Kineococcus halophytocola TaxID=3234027 RepID=A0ABV4GY64_9ACTN
MSTSPSRRDAAVRARALAVRQFRTAGDGLDDELDDEIDDELDDEIDDELDAEFSDEFDDGLDAHPTGPRAAPGVVGEWSRRLADRTPPGWRAVRLRVGPRAVAGAVLVCVLVAAGLGFAAWRSWPDPAAPQGQALPARTAPVAVATGSAPDPTTATPSKTSSPATVVVHVAGRVLRPGIVTLSAGSRVADALTAAGGPAPEADLDALNLARVLQDGEQVLVPAPGQPGAAVPAPAAGAAGPAARVDLNSATAADLDALPGVGEVLAGRIVAWREENGRFSSVEDLGEVRGIGPKVLDGLRDLVSV